MPNLVGLSQDAVLNRLKSSGLTLGTVSGTVGSLVTAQDPPAEQCIDPTVPIDVTLGVTTSNFVSVPNVLGFSIARARRAVQARGLRFFTRSPTGFVSSQYPPKGTAVAPGRTVSVTIGSRILVRYVEVPDVRGDSVDAARTALSNIGLTLSTPASSGTVATQNPQPRQRAPIGSTVSVTIALVVAPTSARARSPLRYWVIAALALVAVAVAGGSIAHGRLHDDHRQGETNPLPPAPKVTKLLIADTVHTTRGGPAGPTVELRTRKRESLTITRIP